MVQAAGFPGELTDGGERYGPHKHPLPPDVFDTISQGNYEAWK